MAFLHLPRWYVDEACTVPYAPPDKVYDGKVTFHAGWKIKEYTVKWVTDSFSESKNTYYQIDNIPIIKRNGNMRFHNKGVIYLHTYRVCWYATG